MRAFLCAVDESVWDSVENGYVKPITAKSKWDKVALALANANSKAINAIFCGVSTNEFHRISHVEIAKETWTILETIYECFQYLKVILLGKIYIYIYIYIFKGHDWEFNNPI